MSSKALPLFDPPTIEAGQVRIGGEDVTIAARVRNAGAGTLDLLSSGIEEDDRFAYELVDVVADPDAPGDLLVHILHRPVDPAGDDLARVVLEFDHASPARISAVLRGSTLTRCPDGFIDFGDECVDPALINPACGNGFIDDGEQCDGSPDCSDRCTYFVGLPCNWTLEKTFAMEAEPPGSTKKNGSYKGQQVESVGNRSAWHQTSDWNMLFLPPTFDSTFDAAAIEVDLYITAAEVERTASLNLMVNPAVDAFATFENDIIHGLSAGIACDRPSAKMRASVSQYASNSTQSLCCSSGAPAKGLFSAPATPLSCTDIMDRWVTMRLEASRRIGLGSLQINGTEIGRFATDFDATGTRSSLYSGAPSWRSSQVAFSNVRIHRGVCP